MRKVARIAGARREESQNREGERGAEGTETRKREDETALDIGRPAGGASAVIGSYAGAPNGD